MSFCSPPWSVSPSTTPGDAAVPLLEIHTRSPMMFAPLRTWMRVSRRIFGGPSSSTSSVMMRRSFGRTVGGTKRDAGDHADLLSVEPDLVPRMTPRASRRLRRRA